MQNKNLIVLLIIIVVLSAVFFLFAGERAQAPTIGETEPTTEATDYVGMTLAEAEAYAAANNVAFRVGTIDGESMPVTMDYRIGRITAAVTDGVVVSYTVEQ